LKSTPNPMRRLLDRIRADKIAPIGIDEYVQVDSLLIRCPELGHSGQREQLRYALASLLATDPDQWKKIWHLSHEFLAGDQADRLVTPIVLQDNPVTGPALRPFAPVTSVVQTVADLPRWWLGTVVAMLIALMVYGIFVMGGVFDAVPERHSDPSAELSRPENPTSTQWRKVPLLPDERRVEVTVQQPARDLDADDAQVFLIGAILLIIGGCWFALPWMVEKRRIKESLENVERGLKLRRDMSGEAERNNVPRRLTYHVVRVPPMREDAAADTAIMLGRLFGRVGGETLDLERTIDATIAAGGRFVPVNNERRVSRAITLLVDVEGGSHPWLNDIEWLFDRWRALGVQFQRYDFHFEPLFLIETATRLPVQLEKLARRVEGEPLLIVSRKLTSKQYRGEASWLRHVQAWTVRAWLDPAPRPPEDLPQAYQAEIDRLKERGFRRFPFSDEGLVALAGYLVTEGQEVAMPDWPDLPPLSDPKVMEAVEKWALFSSLVPDATWDQLQAVRESFPEIRSVLKDNRHLQRLLDWVESQNATQSAESADGMTLELDPALVDDLILRFRIAEVGLPDEQRLEARCRRLLLTQLGATEPDDPLMREFWQLKHMRHQLAINPDKAATLLGPLIAGPWHNEAIEAVSVELNRDKVTESLPRATRDGFSLVAGLGRNRPRIGSLIRLPLPLLAGAAAAVLTVGSIAIVSLNHIPPISEKFLRASYNFEGVVPRDHNIVPGGPTVQDPEIREIAPADAETAKIAERSRLADVEQLRREIEKAGHDLERLLYLRQRCAKDSCTNAMQEELLKQIVGALDTQYKKTAERLYDNLAKVDTIQRDLRLQLEKIGRENDPVLSERLREELNRTRMQLEDVQMASGRYRAIREALANLLLQGPRSNELIKEFETRFLREEFESRAVQLELEDLRRRLDAGIAGSATLWESEGSSLKLVTGENNKRAFVFEVPRAAHLAAGASPGSYAFSGTGRSNRYEGQAYAYSAGCGPIAYDVRGTMSPDERQVTLTGRMPLRDSKCKIMSTSEVTTKYMLKDAKDRPNANK
jgi:hypothetical protein